MLQLSQRPLMATEADAKLFVGRTSQIATMERALRHGFNILVLGERGSGRTSLLHRLEHSLGRSGTPVRFADATGASSFQDLLELLRYSIHRTEDAIDRAAHAVPVRHGSTGDPREDIHWLRPLEEEHLVVMVDGVADPSLVTSLFGRYRDEVWELPITWVVAGELHDRTWLLQPPADAFFDVEVVVPDLTAAEVGDLLRTRADAAADDPDAAAVRELAALLSETNEGATPRRILAEARRMLVDGAADVAVHLARVNAAQAKASAIGRSAVMLHTELLALGPVSASDPQLLDRLGWTRARAAQVLHDLEEAGLVVASDEVRSTPGRPRRIYRVVVDGAGAP